mgnify:CR=1 FL=1
MSWFASWTLYVGLLGVFSVYSCEFFAIGSESGSGIGLEAPAGQALLLSWAWSIVQRFVVNEPVLIFASTGIPMCFASAFCGNFCGESIVTCAGVVFETVLAVVKELTRV